MNQSELTNFVHIFVQGSSSRTLLLLHGTGGDENDLIPLGRALAADANLLSPRGRVLENGLPRFFRRLAEGIFDEEDLIRRTDELAHFIEQAAVTHHLDRKEVFAVGYSNGGNIAGGLLLLRPGILAGAVLFRPMVPIVPESLPNLKNTPVLVVSGRQDPIVPLDEAQRLVQMLRDAGAPVDFSVEDGGHGLSEETVRTAKRWLAAHLNAADLC